MRLPDGQGRRCGMTELFEYILIALACPLILPFVDMDKEGEANEGTD